MGGIGQHLEGLDSIRLEWTVEYQESGEFEITFNLVPSSVVDLEPDQLYPSHPEAREAHLVLIQLHGLVTQCQDSGSTSGIPSISLIIPFWYFRVHALERLGCTFDSHSPFPTARIIDGRNSRHSLEGRRELVSSFNVDLEFMRCVLGVGG